MWKKKYRLFALKNTFIIFFKYVGKISCRFNVATPKNIKINEK